MFSHGFTDFILIKVVLKFHEKNGNILLYHLSNSEVHIKFLIGESVAKKICVQLHSAIQRTSNKKSICGKRLDHEYRFQNSISYLCTSQIQYNV
jgi:uncharacterized protein YwlG (UPF0340 family)